MSEDLKNKCFAKFKSALKEYYDQYVEYHSIDSHTLSNIKMIHFEQCLNRVLSKYDASKHGPTMHTPEKLFIMYFINRINFIKIELRMSMTSTKGQRLGKFYQAENIRIQYEKEMLKNKIINIE